METLQDQNQLNNNNSFQDDEILKQYERLKLKYKTNYLKKKEKLQQQKQSLRNDDKNNFESEINRIKNLKGIKRMLEPKKKKGRPKGNYKSYKKLYEELINEMKQTETIENIEPIIKKGLTEINILEQVL